MYSLAQKRMMALKAGEKIIILTEDEVTQLLASQDKLISVAEKFIEHVPIENIMGHMQDDVWQGSYKQFLKPSTQNEDGGCTVSMSQAENMLAEMSELDVLIAEWMEHVPEEVVAEATNCPGCKKHPYECECE